MPACLLCIHFSWRWKRDFHEPLSHMHRKAELISTSPGGAGWIGPSRHETDLHLSGSWNKLCVMSDGVCVPTEQLVFLENLQTLMTFPQFDWCETVKNSNTWGWREKVTDTQMDDGSRKLWVKDVTPPPLYIIVASTNGPETPHNGVCISDDKSCYASVHKHTRSWNRNTFLSVFLISAIVQLTGHFPSQTLKLLCFWFRFNSLKQVLNSSHSKHHILLNTHWTIRYTPEITTWCQSLTWWRWVSPSCPSVSLSFTLNYESVVRRAGAFHGRPTTRGVGMGEWEAIFESALRSVKKNK